MSVGDDIKQAYQEVGMHYAIIRGGVPLASGEYLIYNTNQQASKPFVRNFVTEASLAYDTVVKSGDVLILDDGHKFLTMVLSPDILENSVIENLTTLYGVNVSGELYRYSGESQDSLYHTTQVFDLLASDVYGLLTPVEFGTGLEPEDMAQIETRRLSLFVSSYYQAQVHDRYVPVSGEHYKVRAINRRMFSGVDLLNLEEDTRE